MSQYFEHALDLKAGQSVLFNSLLSRPSRFEAASELAKTLFASGVGLSSFPKKNNFPE